MRQIQPIYEPLTEEEALSLGFPKRVLLRSGITGKVHFEDGREVLVAAVSEPESVGQEIDNEQAHEVIPTMVMEDGTAFMPHISDHDGSQLLLRSNGGEIILKASDLINDKTVRAYLSLELAKQLLNQLSWLIEKLES